MSTQAAASGEPLNSSYWASRRDGLFLASCIALIVTAMSFAIRGNIINDLGKQFHLSNEQLGLIAGTAFWGFALATIIGGPLCDVVGMRSILTVAFIGHAIGIVTTITATGFMSLYLGTLAFGLANGCVEAACNPLIATLYPDQKIRRLSMFHSWFPGGIVIGGLVAYAISSLHIGGESFWKVQMATMALPLVVYGIMFFGKKFPKTERTASGITGSQMVSACLQPLFIAFVICMIMTAATELVTGQWLPSIISVTTGVGGDGILFLVWINGLMAVGRMFAGPIVHRMSPVAMLIISALFSFIGLSLLSRADSAATAAIAATLFAVGVCFFWPTMLGVVSERFPRTGALGLSIMGGMGMLSTAVFLPIVGGRYDAGIQQAVPAGTTVDALKNAAPGSEAAKQWLSAQAAGGRAGLSVLVILPVILFVAFIALYLYDKSRGGYKQEVLTQMNEGDVLADAQLSPVNQA